jgi:SAM-dependent methyltransferase
MEKQTETINTPSPSQSSIPENTIAKRAPKRKLVITESEPTKTYRNCSRQKSSKLTDFHRRFKHMISTNYNAGNVSREDFNAYHQEADKHDARDTVEMSAFENVLRLLLQARPNFNRRTYNAIDLGCGMNRLRKHKDVCKATWDSLDIHAVDDTVTVGNIGNMKPLYEDETFDVVIVNRALWGTDYDVMLNEIQRIVKAGGIVVFCESVGRWVKKSEDKKTNILPSEIEKCGLAITKQEGTQIDADGSHDLWQYVVATKQ